MSVKDADALILVKAARSMIGCPFLLHGRNPATGLDCVGLVAACLSATGREPLVPDGYALRNHSIERWIHCAKRSGLEPVSTSPEPGDIVMTSPAASQHHLMVVEHGRRAIHAHAGLRRVVSEPLPDRFDPIIQWRLSPRKGI
ncbi:hypothetical protein [Erythrobacter sp.]|uniref:hypothetical protein n=1 Tax=Erythrobacter sp. TaxID=1042 RepID=UPI001425BFF0|nr:hypothetical protein [Erythrobacter sp.]QIQ85241.1 MAG: hypothetical protein G9473_14125 [Erythrobacter sp.]